MFALCLGALSNLEARIINFQTINNTLYIQTLPRIVWYCVVQIYFSETYSLTGDARTAEQFHCRIGVVRATGVLHIDVSFTREGYMHTDQ